MLNRLVGNRPSSQSPPDFRRVGLRLYGAESDPDAELHSVLAAAKQLLAHAHDSYHRFFSMKPNAADGERESDRVATQTCPGYF
jgi:hypothetical protein